MLNYEELVQKSRDLGKNIDENLEKQKLLQTQEIVMKSRAEYQRNAYTRKLREKLNVVISSRNKANESNKRLLADFDRIQKHLIMMDSKTEALISKVNSQKKYLDIHYPNWRERANMFSSPSYLSQENMFNLLDSLRCNLKDDDHVSFETFTNHDKFNFEGYKSLVSLLDDKRIHNKKLDKSPKKVPETSKAYENRDEFSEGNSLKTLPLGKDSRRHPTSLADHDDKYTNENRGEDFHVNRQEPTVDTLTNITESADVSLNLRADELTEDILSPRGMHDFSVHSATASVSQDPLESAERFSSYKFSSGVAYNEGTASDSSEGNIEDMLNPIKTPATSKPYSPPPSPRKSPEPTRDQNASIDSPGGSVDTVIKSPITIVKKKSTRLTTLTSQTSVDTETESIVKPAARISAAPSKRKTALDLLNDSSGSEVVLNNDKSTKTIDSEDDFDFFD